MDSRYIKLGVTPNELHVQENLEHLPAKLKNQNANLKSCEPKHGPRGYHPYEHDRN